LRKNVDWLLLRSSAPVRYLTRLHILHAQPESREMVDLWEAVENDPVGVEVFSKQEADGSWCAGGPWAPKPTYLQKGGYTPVSPKYVTTVWILSILGDMGYTISDERVRRACEYTLSFLRPNGVLSESRAPVGPAYFDENPRNVPCRTSIQLAGLSSVGMGADPRLRKSFDLLVRWQREDGGWVQEGHRDGTAAPYKIWNRSCPWVTSFATKALFHSSKPEHREATLKALRFLLWHLDQKGEQDVRRFFWHGHDAVRELLMFSEMGFNPSQRSIKILLDWLEGMYSPDEGAFHYQGKPISKMRVRQDGADPRVMKYRLFHLIEDDWLTYWMTRIETNFLESM